MSKKKQPKLGRPKIANPASVSIALRITPEQKNLIRRVQVKLAAWEGVIVSPKDVLTKGLELLAIQLNA